MTENSSCLLCYQKLESSEKNYHTTCSEEMFAKPKPPILPYRLDELTKLAKHIVRSSVTVPGVQAKLSLHLSRRGKNADRLTLVGLWGNYILKPPVERFPQMPEIEDLTMHLANFFKIDTVPHGLIPLRSGELAYITRRIDRDKYGAKLHMEDMCQLTQRLTEDKYKGSMEQIAKAIKIYSSNPMLDVIHFFEQTIFSFITGNADMHLKNFSLIRDEQNYIVLTPAYDMLSTRLLIAEKDDPDELALTMNGKKSKFKFKDFIKFSETIGLDTRQTENSFRNFRSGLPAAISFIDQGFLNRNNKRRFKELILERSGRLGLSKV